MTWKIDYTDTVIKQLRKLDKQNAKRIMDYMDNHVARLENPRNIGKALKGKFGDFWRYRVGSFRVICEIQDNKLQILLLRVGNRSNVYRVDRKN